MGSHCDYTVVAKTVRALVGTVDSPIPPLSGTGKKNSLYRRKTAVKGVIYNQEKTYSGLENQRRYGERRSTEGRYWRGGIGGTNVYSIVHHGQIKQLVHT